MQLELGRHHPNVAAELAGDLLQHLQPRRMNPIIVGHQDAQGGLRHYATLVLLARNHGVACTAAWLTTPLETCLEELEHAMTEDKVPEDFARKIHADLLRYPPKMREGYESLHKLDLSAGVAGLDALTIKESPSLEYSSTPFPF